MKKITILMVILMLSCMQMMAQTYAEKGTITLSHQGIESSFAYNKLAEVVSTAADGDTIYLSSGYFDGDVILDKKLVFIGSGADEDSDCTTFYGRFIIKMPENTKLTARLFEGIRFFNYYDDGITFQNTIENVVFKKCSGMWGYTIKGEIKSILYDRCSLRGYYNTLKDSNIKKVIARNCVITEYNIVDSSDPIKIQLFNCNIHPADRWISNNKEYRGLILDGNYTNCIISNGGYPLYDKDNKDKTSSAVFTNCLFEKPEDGADIFNGASVKNNMFYEPTSEGDVNIDTMTKEQLQANGFLGNDGTVVGYWGGKNPYSLKISAPAIFSKKIHFDKEKKQVQIKMKVSLQ